MGRKIIYCTVERNGLATGMTRHLTSFFSIDLSTMYSTQGDQVTPLSSLEETSQPIYSIFQKVKNSFRAKSLQLKNYGPRSFGVR
jgi:hypothetical protein